MFAYSPLERPNTAGLPKRGEATYQGDSVAVDHFDQLYSGTIELNVAFSTARVGGRVKDLETDGGKPWSYRSKDVESIGLPRVSFGEDGAFTSTADISVRFSDSSQDLPVSSSEFEGEFVNEGSEVLGIWKIGTVLDGAFGATRSSTAAATGPPVDDRGEDSKTSLGNSVAPVNGRITIDPAGSQPAIHYDATELYIANGESETEDPFVKTAKDEIEKQKALVTTLINGGTVTSTTDEIFSAASGST